MKVIAGQAIEAMFIKLCDIALDYAKYPGRSGTPVTHIRQVIDAHIVDIPNELLTICDYANVCHYNTNTIFHLPSWKPEDTQ